jgi:hypothetical protein
VGGSVIPSRRAVATPVGAAPSRPVIRPLKTAGIRSRIPGTTAKTRATAAARPVPASTVPIPEPTGATIRRTAAPLEAPALAADIARRLSSDAVEATVAAAQQADDPGFTNWRPAGLWGGHAGLAILAASLDAVDPEYGWDGVGLDHLRHAVRGMEAERATRVGLAGLAGLATAASLLSRDGTRYDKLLTTLEGALVERVERASERVLGSRPHGVPVALFDVISGLTGAGRYLLDRAQSEPCRQALQTLLRAFVYLSEEGADAVPHWHTGFRHATEALRDAHPDGNVNLGMAHGLPGPLALLSLSASHGVEVGRQHDAIVRTADLLVHAQCSDEWGAGFPSAVSIRAPRGEATGPTRSAWCYGPPGVARALWLAGAASGRSEYRDLALAAMTAVFERPAPDRRIDSPTLCHGVAGLLQVTLRFAREGAGTSFSSAAQALTAQLLAAYEPESRFGYRDLKPSGVRVDNPGLLEGAAGVALVLLAAATSAEPAWDRILMLS